MFKIKGLVKVDKSKHIMYRYKYRDCFIFRIKKIKKLKTITDNHWGVIPSSEVTTKGLTLFTEKTLAKLCKGIDDRIDCNSIKFIKENI